MKPLCPLYDNYGNSICSVNGYTYGTSGFLDDLGKQLTTSIGQVTTALTTKIVNKSNAQETAVRTNTPQLFTNPQDGKQYYVMPNGSIQPVATVTTAKQSNSNMLPILLGAAVLGGFLLLRK